MEEALILGRYRPLADIGEGGHGSVELAFDTKMTRRVAIKRIPVSSAGIRILSGTTGLQEARTAALLNHPNIVTVYEWDTDDDEAFLIMEHVDGASLADVLDGYAPLDLDEAASLLSQISAALAYAHENGVLHLDLKPENVLLMRDGLVKVGDFGVAALTNAAGQAISAGGTLGYMPPEQLRGEALDSRADVWAFAALAFQALTGSTPFAASSIEGALFKIERADVPAASGYVRTLPHAIDEILAEALSPDPDDRPADVAGLMAELATYLGDATGGRERLHGLVEELTAEEEPDEGVDDDLLRLGLWDRLASRAAIGERAVCAIASAWLGWAGTLAVGFGWGPAAVAAVVAGAVGAIAPMLGVGAGLVLFVAGAFVTSIPLGLAVAVAGGLWWFFVARVRPGAGATPVLAPLTGVLHVSPALPVLTGFFVHETWAAAASGAMSGLMLVAASLTGASRHPATVAWQQLVAPLAPHAIPGLTWAAAARSAAIVVAWAAAAAVSAVAARRGTRLSAAVGSGLGLTLCAAGLGPWVTGGSQMSTEAVLQLGLASILVLVVIALGPPVPLGADDEDEPEA